MYTKVTDWMDIILLVVYFLTFVLLI